MYIACPECGFKRNVNISQIPASANTATCPKCEQKFRFRDPKTGELLPLVSETDDSTQSTEQHSEENTQNALKDTPSENKESDLEINTLSDTTHDIKPQNYSESQDNSSVNEHTSVSNDAQESEIAPFQQKSDPEPLDVKEIKGDHEESDPLNTEETEYADEDDDRKYVMVTDDVPWEHPERYGIVGSLVQTILRVMFRAPDFFRTIHSPVSALRPALFYALIGLFQALTARLWSMNALQLLSEATTDPQQQVVIENMMSGFSTPLLIIIVPFAMILQLMIFTAFVYLAVRIANPEKADFGLILRVIAYASAPLILALVPYIGGVIGFVWFVVNIIIGIKYALNLPWQRTALALTPILLLWLFMASHQVARLISTLQPV